MDPHRCDVPLGEYAVVVGRLVKAGSRWGKLDVSVLAKATKSLAR
jgi:hypothetical protein